ncbi:MAG: DUF190 domain-containing protein [Candidatus Hydrogenedentota bacterium]|nr:MAG: DUF190 domain-containing protein [Candidatus Hydrogenedentota bacterium]
MKIEDERLLLQIFVNKRDRYKGRQVYKVLLDIFLDHQVSGCSVYRTLAGYGESFVLKKARGPAFLKNKGLVVQVVETKRKIDEILPIVENIIPNGLVTITPAHVIRYSRNKPTKDDVRLSEETQSASVSNLELR